MSPQTPHVLIVGAGIGGLTLAQCLRKQGVSFEIFERDEAITSRGQGYCIGLYESGPLPLPPIRSHLTRSSLEKLVGHALPDDLPPLASTCHLLPLPLNSQVIYYMGQHARLVVEDTPETPCLRADRLRLRELLATGLTIRWGKHAVRVVDDEAAADGKVMVFFKDGASATGDVLVGADGTWSSIRPHVLGRPNAEVLEQFPTACVLGELRLGPAEMERQTRMGHSCWVVVQPSYTLFSGAAGVNVGADGLVDGSYYWLFSQNDVDVSRPDHWTKTSTARELLERVRAETTDLAPEFRATIEATEPEGIRVGFAWWDALISEFPRPVSRVVLIGDACHPMTPGMVFSFHSSHSNSLLPGIV